MEWRRMVSQEIDLREGGPEALIGVVRRNSSERLRGFVMDVGHTWAVIANFADSITLDGYHILRVADVIDVTALSDSQELAHQSLALQGLWPPRRPSMHIDLDSDHGMFASILNAQREVLLYTENDDEDVLYVGHPIELATDELIIREIDPTGVWSDVLTGWSFDEVTRVDLDSAYGGRLFAVASLHPVD